MTSGVSAGYTGMRLPGPGASALSDSRVAPVTVFVLCLTMLFAILAGGLEMLYLERQQIASVVEHIALLVIVVGLAVVILLLLLLRGQYLDQIALAVFAGAVAYIFTMLGSALLLDRDLARSLHTVLWLHPAFVAVTLTQPIKLAQGMCWLVIALLSGVLFYFEGEYAGDALASTSFVNHLLVILSLCASTSLLYGLSVYRETQGADRARIELLRQSAAELSAEVEAKEKARAEMERANTVITGFLNNMSHELRTPLNAIIGFSELIHGQMFGPLANEKYREYAGDILGSGQHLLKLVNDLLFFSNLSAGNISLRLSELDAVRLLNEAAHSLQSAAGGARVEIVVQSEGSPVVMADANGIKLALQALLDNAVKFSRQGGQVILQVRPVDGGGVEISVTDSGVGIADDEVAEIFTPFRRGKSSELKAVPGTGVGLAIVKMLVEMHGGTISIHSKEYAGTSVSLTLPPQAKMTGTG